MGDAAEISNGGYTGAGYVNVDNAIGSNIVWRVEASIAGAAQLTVRFANGGAAARPGRLSVEGAVNGAYNFSLPATNGWTSWQTEAVTVQLGEGENTLVLSSTSTDGLANVDSLQVSGTGLRAVECTGSGGSSSGEAGLAFPGAQGFGRMTTGGRGGDVYHVTNLNDSGAGSLREGVASGSGARTVVFDVSGNIMLQSPLNIRRSNLTIAGQSAPEGGITVAGYPTNIVADNVILRFMRFRCGDYNVYDENGVLPDRGNADLKGSSAGALDVGDANQVIIDHVSTSWSVDEVLSVTRSNNVTVQNSIIAEALQNSYHAKGAHGFGSLIRAAQNHDGGYTYYRNLYAHNDMRNPGVGPFQPSSSLSEAEQLSLLREYYLQFDFVNNVVYGWGARQGESIDGSKDGRVEINMVNNYYIANASSDDPQAIWDDEKNDAIYAYQSGNKVDGNRNSTLDGSNGGWAMFTGFDASQQISSRWEYPAVATGTAEAAFEWVRQYVGASLYRDAVDERVINQMLTNTGGLIDSQEDVGGLPSIPSKTAPADTDRDGMPDAWEEAQTLDKNNAADGNAYTLDSHYTNLEVYLNSLITFQ